MVHAADTREVARKELIERWDQERMARSVDSQIILTHTNDEVRELNQMARGKMRTAGALGAAATTQAARRARQFASGARIILLRNTPGPGTTTGPWPRWARH